MTGLYSDKREDLFHKFKEFWLRLSTQVTDANAYKPIGWDNFATDEERYGIALLTDSSWLTQPMIVSAYSTGFFPWPDDDQDKVYWATPATRWIIRPTALRVNRSLQRAIRKNNLTITCNADFASVIEACSKVPRVGQSGTWITLYMRQVYTEMHLSGFTHSFEAWDENEDLVGGLYGIALGKFFFGESMFSLAPSASKIVLAKAVEWLGEQGFRWLDTQIHSPHVESLGAEPISRQLFLEELATYLPLHPEAMKSGLPMREDGYVGF